MKWHEGAGPCRHCGGRHWHRDCPRRQQNTVMEANGKRAGAAALAADAEATDSALGDALRRRWHCRLLCEFGRRRPLRARHRRFSTVAS
eukprot:4213167-Pleurochrysis_carterae.AAC.1